MSNKRRNIISKKIEKAQGLSFELFDDAVKIVFLPLKEREKINECNHSEIDIIGFVTNSYKNSCLRLLKEMSRYKCNKDQKSVIDYMHYYLPAMFCFRHYLELKLKYLYMVWCKKSFYMGHSLNNLLSELEDESHTEFSFFEEPIEYINMLESAITSSQEEYCRYLIDKDFNSNSSLVIPMFELKRILSYINTIETRTTIMFLNRMSTN